MLESKYLKKDDVGRGVLVTIRDLQKETIMADDVEKEKWVIYFEELAKGMVLGATTIQQIELACGSDDTDDWTGKKIVVFDDPNVMFKGKLVGGIRVKAVSKKARAPQPQENPAGSTGNYQGQKRGPAPFEDMEDDVPF